VKQIGPFRYFVIFDGHAGTKKMGPDHVADYCMEHLHDFIAMHLEAVDLNDENEVSSAIRAAFISLDVDMEYRKKLYGSTCTMILIDDPRNRIYQINLGDFRSIIFDSDDHIISATIDHNPANHRESERVTIVFGRVYGKLAVTRAFGDFDLKFDPKTKEYSPIGPVSAVQTLKYYFNIRCSIRTSTF